MVFQTRSLISGLALTGCLMTASLAGADPVATAALVVRADFRVRTSLTVSSSVLQFVPEGDGVGAAARVDVKASARVRQGADVILLVEPQWTSADAPPGRVVQFEGVGEGMQRGVLMPGGRAVAGHWSGSGVHSGTVTFRLLEPAAVPDGPLPIQFLLAAP
jgi:hypothetical protein